MEHTSLSPNINELPSHYAERLSKYYSLKTEKSHKKELGQFFTPLVLSNFISSFSSINKNKIKILDPGCGTCILSCSLIEKLAENKKLKEIHLTTYEIDPKLNVHTAAILCYLNDWLIAKGKILNINHRSVDFIHENFLAIDSPPQEKFDIIISNPPYFKISKEDERKEMFKTLSSGQVNIYAVFVAISANMLNTNGELIFIIPRSFASGEYFKVFRKIFFSKIQIEKIHLFNSRKDAFSEDEVLQENLIIKGRKVGRVGLREKIIISQSNGLMDIGTSKIKEYPYLQLINLKSDEKFLHLPNSEEQEKIMKLLKTQKNNLTSLGYKVSTGPIVYFRKTEFLQKEKKRNSVPLYWLDNVKKFNIEHPLNGKSKEQFFANNEDSKPVLIDNRNLVLVRRFSSKDDSSRLIAAVHSKKASNIYSKIGVENKLNYITKVDGNITISEALGITSLLNSYIYDEYFKTFNGNTQVSASELKKIPFPETSTIKFIGSRVSRLSKKNQEKINNIVSKALLEKSKE
jgi:adenine-specific DNA-methyltransferase